MAAQTNFKYRRKKLGGHSHIDVFVRRHGQSTWEKCGTLVMEHTQAYLWKVIVMQDALPDGDVWEDEEDELAEDA